MSENYYDEILDEIEMCCMRNENDRALRLIENELSMPYVPSQLEKKLKELRIEIKADMKNTVRKLPGMEEIEAGLKGDTAAQLKAVDALSQLNCRNCIDWIQEYFDTYSHPNIQALLIETLIDQQISNEFRILYEGQEIVFIPRYAEKPQDTEGFVEAKRLLSNWFESSNPSFMKLCEQLLIQECFLMLPMAYDFMEAESLALSIVESVSNLLDEGETMNELMKDLGIQDFMKFPLKSNNN